MEDAFAFRCSEKETVLVAAGNTMAVDRYKGVIKKAITVETTKPAEVTMINILRLAHNVTNRFIRCSCITLVLSSIPVSYTHLDVYKRQELQ